MNFNQLKKIRTYTIINKKDKKKKGKGLKNHKKSKLKDIGKLDDMKDIPVDEIPPEVVDALKIKSPKNNDESSPEASENSDN